MVSSCCHYHHIISSHKLLILKERPLSYSIIINTAGLAQITSVGFQTSPSEVISFNPAVPCLSRFVTAHWKACFKNPFQWHLPDRHDLLAWRQTNYRQHMLSAWHKRKWQYAWSFKYVLVKQGSLLASCESHPLGDSIGCPQHKECMLYVSATCSLPGSTAMVWRVLPVNNGWLVDTTCSTDLGHIWKEGKAIPSLPGNSSKSCTVYAHGGRDL